MARTGTEIVHAQVLDFTPIKKAMMTNSPRKIVCGTPLPTSMSLITVPKGAVARLRTTLLHLLDPKCHEAKKGRVLRGHSFPLDPKLAAWLGKEEKQ